MHISNLYLKAIYAIWAKMYGALDRIFPFERSRVIAEVPQGDVLELGVGSGLNLPYYGTQHHVTGVDLSHAMLNVARERGERAELLCLDARNLPFDTDTFDAGVATFFFRLLPDPQVALAEASKVIRPGGLLVIADRFTRGKDLFSLLTIPLGWGKDRHLEDFCVGTPWQVVSSTPLGTSRHNTLLILKNTKNE